MIAACTIAGRNSLAQARVTATSFREQHPGVPFFALLSDDPAGLFDPAGEPFAVLRLADLAAPHLERLRFRYPQPELSYALTPWLLVHLLDRGFERVLFLKQETLVLEPLGSLFDRLGPAAILLTPHLPEPLDGSSQAGEAAAREREILLAGVYNAGVLGVARSAVTRRFLAWWGERLNRHSLRAVEAGMHFEQRWLDFVPSLFPPVAIDRRPGSNLGHWRLPESRIEERRGRLLVDGEPLRVMRFSGFDPDRPEFLTCHHQRVRVAEMGEAGVRLVARYRGALERAGHALARSWPDGSSRFDDGAAIPAAVRAIYRRQTDDDAEPFGDPHRTGRGSFRRWLADRPTAPGKMARIWHEIWADRGDLQAAFPQPAGADRRAFERWIDRHGRAESGLADARWLQSRSAALVSTGLAIVTAAAYPFRSRARVMVRSLRRFHPEVEVLALSVANGEPSPEAFAEASMVRLDELGIPDLPGFRFRYTCREVAIAAKPFLLAHALDRGFASALFLDADLWILAGLEDLFRQVGAHALTLTAHRLLPGATAAEEIRLLRSGTFNGGVLGVSSARSRRFLDWWSARVRADCRMAPEAGLHDDQRWLDLAPGFVDDCAIVNDPGVNAAYWNLDERPLAMQGGRWFAGPAPLRLFHFSGFDVRNVGGREPPLEAAARPARRQLLCRVRPGRRRRGVARFPPDPKKRARSNTSCRPSPTAFRSRASQGLSTRSRPAPKCSAIRRPAGAAPTSPGCSNPGSRSPDEPMRPPAAAVRCHGSGSRFIAAARTCSRPFPSRAAGTAIASSNGRATTVAANTSSTRRSCPRTPEVPEPRCRRQSSESATWRWRETATSLYSPTASPSPALARSQ